MAKKTLQNPEVQDLTANDAVEDVTQTVEETTETVEETADETPAQEETVVEEEPVLDVYETEIEHEAEILAHETDEPEIEDETPSAESESNPAAVPEMYKQIMPHVEDENDTVVKPVASPKKTEKKFTSEQICEAVYNY